MPDNTYTIPIKEAIESFDPVLCVDETSGIILNLIHRNLYTTDLSGNFVPDLVDKVVIGNNRVFVRIKNGIYFTGDNNIELTADDVFFTLHRLKSSGRQPWVLDRITEIQVLNRYTLVFYLDLKSSEDWTRQTYLLSLPQTAIYSGKIYQESGQFIGASGVSVETYNQENILLSANHKTKINYRVIPSESGRWFNYKRRKIDLYEAGGVFQFMPNNLEGYKKILKNEAIVLYGAIVSSPESVLADREFRKMLNYRIDRKNLTEKILLKSFTPADYPVPDVLGMHLGPFYNHRPDYQCGNNPDSGSDETVDIYTLADRDRQLVARVIYSALADCNVAAKIRVVDLATMLKFNNEQKKGIYLLKWIADYPHPENFLIPLFHSKNKGTGGNRSFYSNPDLDQLLDRGVTNDNLEEIQDLIRKDAPWIFIGFSQKTYYVNEEKNLKLPAVYTGWNENAFGL